MVNKKGSSMVNKETWEVEVKGRQGVVQGACCEHREVNMVNVVNMVNMQGDRRDHEGDGTLWSWWNMWVGDCICMQCIVCCMHPCVYVFHVYTYVYLRRMRRRFRKQHTRRKHRDQVCAVCMWVCHVYVMNVEQHKLVISCTSLYMHSTHQLYSIVVMHNNTQQHTGVE